MDGWIGLSGCGCGKWKVDCGAVPDLTQKTTSKQLQLLCWFINTGLSINVESNQRYEAPFSSHLCYSAGKGEGGGVNAKFGLDFQHQSPLKRSGFKMTQCIRHLQHVTGAYIICLKMDSDITPFPNFYNVQNLAFEGV